MDVTIHPSSLGGSIPAMSSKSMAHRLLILAALAHDPCSVAFGTASEDITATSSCLETLGLGTLSSSQDAFQTGSSTGDPEGRDREMVELDCGESGSTLRFLLPVVGALNRSATFVRRGRLANRPLSPFVEQLTQHGMCIEEDGALLKTQGKLHGGSFVLPGNVSSQYVSGLLLAAPIIGESVEIFVSTPVESRPYIELTMAALEQFGVVVACDKVGYGAHTSERFALTPEPLNAAPQYVVEGDWSNAAFWLAAGTLEHEGIAVHGLNLASVQGDRAILAALASLGARIARRGDAARATRDNPRAATFDVSSIPDLVPPLAAVAATQPGTSRLRNAGRLRLKESDRLATVTAVVNTLGGKASVAGDDLVITGVPQLCGGVVDAANDHRVAMMAAIMATHASDRVTVRGAQCVAKSYPTFWEDYERLGGSIERSGF